MTILHPPIDPWLGETVRAYLRGDGLELLEPLRFCAPGSSPSSFAGPPDSGPRGELAESLERFNADVGNPRAKALADQLADPQVEVVVTGQQAGLFGGPVYAVAKALAATLWARRLREEGRPAVAVFWIASEDHDFDEVRRACFGEHTVSVAPIRDDTRPVAERIVDERLHREIAAAVTECASSVQAPPFLEDALHLAEECYAVGTPWGVGFARLTARLLGDACPLLLDSRDPVLKADQGRRLGAFLEDGEGVRAAIRAVEERERAFAEAGLELQVPPARCDNGAYALPLFVHRGGCRFRVLVEDGAEGGDLPYRLRGFEEEGTLAELGVRAREEPLETSPAALLRPVLQDAALATSLQLLGPGELAYVGQGAPLYDVLGVPTPSVALRPQAVFLPERLHGHLVELVEAEGLSTSLLLGPWEELGPKLAEKGDNGSLGALDDLGLELDRSFGGIEDRLLELDAHLDGPLEKTRDHLRRGLEKLRGRVEKAAVQRAGVIRGRVERIRDFLVPEGTLQERRLCSLWLHAQFGSDFLEQIEPALSLDPRHLQVLSMR